MHLSFKKISLTAFLACLFAFAKSQTLGGNAIFNFLKLPNTPQLTAHGGINVSNISNDIGMSFNNPSLLRPAMHMQLTTVFNSMFAGIKNYHLMMGYSSEQLQTNVAFGVHYLDYGSIPQTDAAGNVLGSFRPGDYVIQLSASRKYLKKWYYGASFKFINSNYGLYRSNGIAMDAGVTYYDSTQFVQISLVLKNMGTQLKEYQGAQSEEIPFDLVIGITKKLQQAPLQFSITAHHLHRFNLLYNDTVYNSSNGFSQTEGKFTVDNVARHFIFSTQLFIGEKVEVTAAYNHLRRTELNLYQSTNGLNGFSLGLGVLFNKIQIRYARAYYQNNTAHNHFGLNLRLHEFTISGNSAKQTIW